MISWEVFPPFALVAVLCWAIGTVAALRKEDGRSAVCVWTTAAGLAVYTAFIIGLWSALGRPPLRTLGETRLWYSFFMVFSGWLVYLQWNYRWLPLSSLVVALVFIVINVVRPDIHDRSLMPALQSAWFVPHVTVYMFSYSLFGCAFVLALAGLYRHTGQYLRSTDTLVRIGLAFLTFGMLSGCIWAKQAWGDYWSWDPKETWAAATWCAYLVYVHLRQRKADGTAGRTAYVWLLIGFLLLQMCWYGVNFLPSAAESLHSY